MVGSTSKTVGAGLARMFDKNLIPSKQVMFEWQIYQDEYHDLSK